LYYFSINFINLNDIYFQSLFKNKKKYKNKKLWQFYKYMFT